MPDDKNDLIAQPEGMSSHPAGTEVQVSVRGPKLAPDFSKELRARAHAIRAVGVLPTARDSVENITAGEINRLTEVESFITREMDSNSMMEERLYTIIVQRD